MTPIGEINPIIDSTVLIAFFNKNDKFFKDAKEIITKQETPVIVLDAVLHETLALLRKRVSKKVAVKAASILSHSSFFILKFSGTNIVAEALSLFISENGKYSFADCVIATEGNLQKSGILTFDKHFRNFKLDVIPHE